LTQGYRAADIDRLLPKWASRLVVLVLLVIVIVPVGYMILLSLTPNQTVSLGKISFLSPDFHNYVAMWSDAPLASGLVHTIIIAGVSGLASVVLGLLAAYPLTRFVFPGRKLYMYVLLGTQTVPGTTLILPLFAVLSFIQTQLSTQFIGTYWPIIITYMTFGLPLCTWLIMSYLQTIPRNLEEAGLVDGCSRLGALRRVVLPIAVPAMVVAFVFSFLVGWNDVLFASVFTNTSTQTLAVVVERFANTQSGVGLPLYGEFMAAAVVSSLPVVILYLVFQRFLTDGLAAGSMTGV
jgi:ABC-type glycerol-3-phosphate transport system permease component